MIPIFRPCMGREEEEAVIEVLRSGWIGMGPKVGEFEDAFAKRVGARYAIAMNSATAALHLSLLAMNIGPGDEVLVPTITFVSTAHAVEYCGATAVFVDVEPGTLNIDVDDVERKITSHTQAIIPVHYGGRPADMSAIHRLAAERSLWVIEDAAHACGSGFVNRMIGGSLSSDTICFSFHAVKNLSTGDGGMITTPSSLLADRLRKSRWLGIDKSTWGRMDEKRQYGWQYEVRDLGYKYHMNDIAAAIGLAQLKKLVMHNYRREKIAECYSAVLPSIDGIEIPPPLPAGVHSSWHNYVIKLDRRDELHLYLKERGISTGVHYMPIHLHPYYYDPDVSLPVAERVWKRLLTLPVYPDLTEMQQHEIICQILTFMEGQGD